jgi:hypothetical protein
MRRRAIALVFLAGCGHLCARHSDCPAADVCTPEGVCKVAPDAGPDAAPDDSSPVDAADAADAADAPTDGA